MNRTEELLKRKLERLKRWSERSEEILTQRVDELDILYQQPLSEMDSEQEQASRTFKDEEKNLLVQISQAGKEYSTNKYKLERDVERNKSAIERADAEFKKLIQSEINFEKAGKLIK